MSMSEIEEPDPPKPPQQPGQTAAPSLEVGTRRAGGRDSAGKADGSRRPKARSKGSDGAVVHSHRARRERRAQTEKEESEGDGRRGGDQSDSEKGARRGDSDPSTLTNRAAGPGC